MTYPVTPYTWTIDGVSFGTGDGNYLPEVEGWWGTPEPRMNVTPKVGADGVFLGGSYLGPRILDVKGCWMPGSREASDAALDTLTALCRSSDPLAEFVISRVQGSRARWTWCKLNDGLLPKVGRSGLITWDAQFICADYRMWSVDPVSWDPTGLTTEPIGGALWNGSTGTSGDGLLWNGSTGMSGDGVVYQTANGSGGVLSVQNLGNDTAPVTFRITATGGTGLTNPWVSISGTGETIQYNGTLDVGSYLDVDTGTTRVRLNGTNAPGVLSRSQFFQIPASSIRTITFGATGISDQGLLTGSHYHAYQGG
jgi:hypothetical protein